VVVASFVGAAVTAVATCNLWLYLYIYNHYHMKETRI